MVEHFTEIKSLNFIGSLSYLIGEIVTNEVQQFFSTVYGFFVFSVFFRLFIRENC